MAIRQRERERLLELRKKLNEQQIHLKKLSPNITSTFDHEAYYQPPKHHHSHDIPFQALIIPENIASI